MSYISAGSLQNGGSSTFVETFVDTTDYTAGTTTQLTLENTPATENTVWVMFDGVVQHHTEYSIAANVITFTVAIPLGTNAVEVQNNTELQVAVPADVSVTTSKIQDGAVTAVKLAEDYVQVGGDIMTGNLTAPAIIATDTSGGLQWENGRNRINNNDGGGNCQIKFGHKFDVTEVFTAANSGAVKFQSAIDSVQSPLIMAVASNATVANGDTVVWGDALILGHDVLTYNGQTLTTPGQFVSTKATGTAPLVVSSTTKVTNLNADLLDGLSADNASVASTICARDGSADLFCRLVRSSYPLTGATPVSTSGIVFRVDDATNNYHRTMSKTAMQGWLAPDTPTNASYAANWSTFSAVYHPARYWKDGNDVVHIEGVVTHTTGGSGTVIFTLPSGFRPLKANIFPAIAGGSSVYITVTTAGSVSLSSGTAVSWLSLSGISFSIK